MTGHLALAALLLHVLGGQTMPREDLPIGNFLGPNFGNWKATGSAFRLGPAEGAITTKFEITNAGSEPVATSKLEGDQPTGTLTSPAFKITRKYISFRIAGGDYEFATCLNLRIDGRIVKSATGRNSDTLSPDSWDVQPYRGKTAQLEIVDLAKGRWGHIDVSRLRQTDQPERPPTPQAKLYQESLRPQFHFTARQWTMNRLEPRERQEGWVNDLNGLIFYDGEYHLFAQRWAKCWIHAVSKDLIHWHEIQPAFWEESLDSGVQSGTCVIDYANTSGLAQDPQHPAMLAFWPRFDNRTQCIDYSLDHGRTWTRYAKNPILTHPERDPKVFWYAPGKHWVMMLYGEGSYHILTSPNLLDWKDEHHPIPNSFECPDFFELPIDGNLQNKKWVLIQGNGNYSIGTFDGTEFKEEVGRFPCDVGPNFYATQSWANVETGDGRRIQTAWMRGAFFPGMPFNQEISFPCELRLAATPAGLRVLRQPIKEISLLHKTAQHWNLETIPTNQSLILANSGDLFHLTANVTIPKGSTLTLSVRGVPITFTDRTLASGHDPKPAITEVKTIEVLVDRASIETFVNHGEISSTRYVLPTAEGLSLHASGGPVTVNRLSLYTLKSAWK